MIKRILIFLLAASMLAGCGREVPPRPTRDHEETVQTTREETNPNREDMAYDDSLLSEFTYEKTIGEGDSEIQIFYELPLILDDTPDAENLNQLFQWYQQDAEESEYPACESITWESYWNGSLLSILLTIQPLGQGEPAYLPVNYDFAEGREVPPWEIPEWVGVSQEEALAALRRTAAQEFDSFMADTLETCSECYDDVVKLRAATLSEAALSLETTMLYLDQWGELNASLTIYTLSGGGYHYLTVPLRVLPGDTELWQLNFANATVETQGFDLQVVFDSWDAQSGEGVYLGNVEPGIYYPLEGFYGEVMGMAIGPMGIARDVYLAVVDQLGQLYYCNLSIAARTNGGFRLSGPLQYPRDIMGLESNPSERQINVITADESISLLEAIGQAELETAAVLDGTAWMSEDGSAEAEMMMNPDGMSQMYWTTPEYKLNGFFYFDGITEQGLHFRAELVDENSNCLEAVMTFSVPDWWDYSTSVMTLTFPDTGESWELALPEG